MSSLVLDGVSPRSRGTDPVTSVDAGRAADLKGSQRYVLETLETFGPFADHELAEFYLHDRNAEIYGPRFSLQRLRSARSELVEMGKVVATGEFCKTPAGRRAHIWAVA